LNANFLFVAQPAIFSSSRGKFCRFNGVERSSWWVTLPKLNKGACAPHRVWRVSENHNYGLKAWLFEHCRVCLLLIALASFADLPARGGAYLPLAGPPPLRFETAMRHGKIFSWIPPVPPPAAAVETNLPPEISTIPVNKAVSPPPANESNGVSAPLPPENLSTNSAPQTRSANDLLVVTPEMLVDYFKPNNAATNSTNVRVLAPVNFTPPASASTPSSQAIYLSP
jgi:hypothetical protein